MRFDDTWPIRTLGDVASRITVGHVGPMADRYVSSGIPLLRSQNVRPFTLDLTDIVYIDSQFHAELAKSALKAGDVVIVRTGTPGIAAVVPADLGPVNCSDMVIVRPGPSLDPHYLCCCVNVIAREHVSAHLVGAVQQHFNVASARTMPLPVPRIEEQRAIAAVAKILDDKISINHRANRTLEATALALFRSWFEDFDPVLAKAEGRRALGVPEAVHELMPSEFSTSAKGTIPAGWQSSRVVDEFDVRMGQSPPGTSYNDEGEGIAFFQGCTDFGFRFPNRRLFTTAPSRLAETGDTLVSVRAPVGRVNMARERCCIGRGLAAVRHRSGSRSFTYYAMRSIEEHFDVFEGEGTLFGSITRDGFDRIPVFAPPREVVDAFEIQVGILDERIRVNEEESETIVALRDTLLPQLLSGSIRVRDAEYAAVEAI